jgi:hypothetical protein
MRRFKILVAACLTCAALAAVAASSAGAYGGGATHEMWQIGLSENCTNPKPDACAAFGGPGGQWGWAEFDRAGSATWGDAQLTFCGHTIGGGGAGAGHVGIDVLSWYIGSNGDFWVTGEVDTSRGQSETFSPENVDTGIPATPGHYHTADLLGFTAPGLSFNIQVSYRPAV